MHGKKGYLWGTLRLLSRWCFVCLDLVRASWSGADISTRFMALRAVGDICYSMLSLENIEHLLGLVLAKQRNARTNWESKKWMTMKFDSRRFLLVIQRPLVSTDWMVKVENPQTFCHLISYRNRIFVSKSLLLPLPSQSPTQLNCRICVCLVSFNSRDFPVCHLHYWHSNSERAKFFSHFLLHLVIEIILSTETESQILIRWPRRWGILCSQLGCGVAETNI